MPSGWIGAAASSTASGRRAGGGYDRKITGGRMLTGMIDDIHANPVRRGPVERTADWKWSSAA